MFLEYAANEDTLQHILGAWIWEKLTLQHWKLLQAVGSFYRRMALSFAAN
jgi:hypothetical protein